MEEKKAKTMSEWLEDRTTARKIKSFFKYKIWYKVYWPYVELRSWFRDNFNKYHFKSSWTLFKSHPWDDSYMYETQRNQLIEMISQFEKGTVTTSETYAKMLKWMRLAVKMLDIMLDDVDISHSEGEMKFIEEDMNGETVYRMDSSDYKHICDIYVNTRTVRRFASEKYVEYYTVYPDELYKVKAKYIYHMIMFRYSGEWWD